MNQLFVLVQVSTHKDAAEFARLDPYGIGMTLVAMSVVFLSLVILYFTFKNIAKLFAYDFRSKASKENNPIANNSAATLELGAAVALAIHLYQQELHDHETALLTIKKINRNYSPWSSKIYGMRKELK
ncbi:OadG family protein [Flavobacterium lacus]|uniref:Oxaloacetate decarboxylase gamma subunit n=1 Tax=Flavobacterium lacus TaxID=1353778 RepID=A0A328WQ07_9FLAO|nr:OadG family protein [Flavobacterium lacus]RAR47335.1 oxaloacetate decarboxylase gamma subunit [Flavobacterium lacus]